jgi:hypothetical protein
MLRSSMTWVLFLFAVLLLACAPGPMRAPPQANVALMRSGDMPFAMDQRQPNVERQGSVEAFHTPFQLPRGWF